MALQHRERRDDARPPAPRVRATARPLAKPSRFEIRKPGANAAQYDLRLELDGVVKSWTIPRDPDTDPSLKLVALHTEEDVGGAHVDLWDQGTWIAEGPALASYRRGQLKFELKGRRMKGHWALVRMGNASTRKKDLWLLVRRNDRA
jgi:bifunctional non-homologous end joining protein LigD